MAMKSMSQSQVNYYISLGITPLQLEKCREAFEMFDVNENQYIEISELREALENMGHQPSEEELYRMMSEADPKGECRIGFDEFMTIIINQKQRSENLLKNDIQNSFLALGGCPDEKGDITNGRIDVSRMKDVVKRNFNMEIDFNKLGFDLEGDGKTVSFKEFMELMSS